MVITNRKEQLHSNLHNDIEYIWIHINTISFFIYLWVLKTGYWNTFGKNISHRRAGGWWVGGGGGGGGWGVGGGGGVGVGGGGGFDIGNGNWCMLGSHFCNEPGIFVSNRAFLCPTMHFGVEPGFLVSNECYNVILGNISWIIYQGICHINPGAYRWLVYGNITAKGICVRSI